MKVSFRLPERHEKKYLDLQLFLAAQGKVIKDNNGMYAVNEMSVEQVSQFYKQVYWSVQLPKGRRYGTVGGDSPLIVIEEKTNN